ncbi:MAG: hypothetical protein QXT53_06480 [Ignisphaera sp.]
MNSIQSEVVRKILHTIFTLLLLLPLSTPYKSLVSNMFCGVDPTLLTYSILLFVSAFINTIQIKMPYIRMILLNMFRDYRKKILEYISSSQANTPLSELAKELDGIFSRYEDHLISFIDKIERDYEKRYGYVSITFALLSIFLSYVLWGVDVYIGILALAITDSITSIVTILDRRGRKLFKHSIKSYAIAFLVFASILVLLTRNAFISILISAISVVIEMLSPEDNLTIPLVTTLAFSALKGFFLT